jgi:hypothetical protein
LAINLKTAKAAQRLKRSDFPFGIFGIGFI